MKILVLDNNYPSESNLYGDGFVHARVTGYMSHGHAVEVLSFFTREASYSFEGVQVTSAKNLDELRVAIARSGPDIICIHFFQGWMFAKLVVCSTVPVIVWIHGFEAEAWYRRLYEFRWRIDYARYILTNLLQLVRLRKLFAYHERSNNKTGIVFVSRWIQRVATTDTLRSLRRYHVIPNPVNVEFFSFRTKEASQRRRVLLLRSFNSRMYANDLAMEAIRILSAHPDFSQYSFTIVGSGRLFEAETSSVREFPNVSLQERFLSHHEIRELHATHGVFLCPARRETQGVSRCEAMASGLVPVTSNNSAIPEFVRNRETGFLCNSPAEMAGALLQLGSDAARFAEMSASAARAMRQQVAIDIVIPKELEIMKQLTDS